MKKLVIVFFLLSLVSQAQQDAQYSQYMYNTISVNPAYAGSKEALSVIGLHRSQWVGLDGAPVTQTLAFHSPVRKNVGLGLSLINDKIGPSSEVNLNVDFAYTLQLNKNTKLNLGLKAGGHWLDIDFTQLEGGGYFDPRFANNVENLFNPNIGVGAYLFSDKYYIGLSAPQLLNTKHYNDEKNSESYLARERVHAYLIGGYIFDVLDYLKFKPAIMLKGVAGAPLQVDLSANFLFNERFTLGTSYRWSSAVSALAGFQVSDGLFLGYAYDAGTRQLRNYHSGSHELVVMFNFLNKPQQQQQEFEQDQSIGTRFF